MAVMSEVGRRLAPEPLLDSVYVPGAVLAEVGSAEQRARVIPGVAAGTSLLAYAHDEPGVRWPSTALSTKADGQGAAWTLTGCKNPVLRGDCADLFVVSALLPDGGVGLFLVEAQATGVTRTLFRTPDGGRGAQIDFQGAAAELLASGDIAANAIRATGVRHTAALCAEAVGSMAETLRLTSDYLKSRKQFGVPLSTFQTLTHRAADMYVRLELARSMSLYVTMSLADGVVDPVIASRAKLVVNRSARLIGREAIQMHGGIGLTAEYPVGHHVMRLISIEHTLGGSEEHLSVLSGRIGTYETLEIHG
jgi:alkylation response protein AidB-like acyl-CoA dehydrogenase